MYLKRLELTNFRNYGKQVIEPGACLNVFSGRNAQGKTNILESIYFACTGRSFRTSRERDVIRLGFNFASIYAFFEGRNRQFEVKTVLEPGRKKIEVNGSTPRGYPLGWPGVVVFTPDHLEMMRGSPQERRRFLDFEIGPFHPQYEYCLERFNRVLAQRNFLLREIRDRRAQSDTLQAWNEQFCRYGARLLFIRMELLKKFTPLLRGLHRELTGGAEEIEVRYLSSLKLEGTVTEEDIYGTFMDEIRRLENEEIARSHSLIGPHRDDLTFLINGADARFYGSRGQQRTIVLSLKIAQIKHWNEELNDLPLLLLDDVLYELDGSRRRALFGTAAGLFQTFLTVTGEENLNPVVNYDHKRFNVDNGRVFSL